MLIKILDRYTQEGSLYYEWWLHEGPDGIDEVHGYATDLITAFSKIMEWKAKIDQDYANEILEDLENAKHFLSTNDETLS